MADPARRRPRPQGRPGHSRPAARRTPAARRASTGAGGGAPPADAPGKPTATGDGARGRGPRLTGRSAIVLLVLAVLFVSYATSMRAWLEQRAHVDELEAQIAHSRQAVTGLREERRRWDDPAFLEAQARQRFGWVMPGEVGFRVIGLDGRPVAAAELSDPAPAEEAGAQWWGKTWTSLRVAGEPTATPRADAGPAAAEPTQRLGPPPRTRRDQRGSGPQSRAQHGSGRHDSGHRGR